MEAHEQKAVVAGSSVPDALETSFGDEAQIEYVPYGRLCRSPLNVRKKAPTGIETLAGTIAGKGLIQNLVVHPVKGSRAKQPKLGVCAGQRRLAALDLLFSQGKITKDFQVPVLIVSEGEAVAASLIENREREDMHIADESVAFRLLVEEGKSVIHVAALFGTSEVAVRRSLKLASLSPTLLEAFRDDQMDFEQAVALALADDHETQERVWADAREPWQRTPRELRAAITTTEIDASRSHLAKFVGIEVYEAAGGHVRRDLFSDAANAGFITDPDLLHRLATERLVAASQEIACEGWSWIETRTRRDYNEMVAFARLHSVSREPTPEEQAELDALIVKRDAASDALNAYFDTDGEPDEDEQERLEDAANAASDAVDLYGERFETFDADDMKRAGAFVVIDSDGQLSVERGLIRREDAKKVAGGANAVAGVAVGVAAPKKAKPLHGEKLCRRLTAHRTAAIQAELARQPNAALAVLMSRMIPVVFEDVYAREFAEYAIRIEAHTSRDRLLTDADDMADSVAWKEIEGEREKWARMLPERTAELLPWLLVQDVDITSNLFAFCVAATLDGTSAVDRAHPINELADLLHVDLSYYWKPTRVSYFDHVSKARMVDVVAAAVSPEAAANLQGMKKGDAAAAAELRMADSGWLPEVLTNRETPERRSYGYVSADDDADDADEGDGDDEMAATEEEPQDA